MKLATVARPALISAALMAVFLAPANGHDIVLLANPAATPALTLRYGHPGDWLPVDLMKLVDLDVVDAAGRKTSVRDRVRRDGDNYLGDFGTEVRGCVIAGRYDNGFWVTLADGSFRNARRTQVGPEVRALGSFKYAKGWIGDGASACLRPIGHRFEIVPLEDPSASTPASGFRVRVLLDGEPLAGAGVEIGDGVTARREEDIPRYRTDAEGRVRLPIDHAGWQVIAVDHETVTRTPENADRELIVATFTFWLPKR